MPLDLGHCIPAAPPKYKGERASERDCQQTIVGAARLAGYRVLSIRPAFSRGKYSSPIQGDTGYPDLTLAHPVAGVLFVELKRAPNRLEPAQLRWRQALIDAGAVWRLVWVPEQLDSFCQELADLAGVGAAR
jgi:hypothetical protein